jgi:hypothetical protein
VADGARWGDIALVDLPADDSGPRCIDCYTVEVERFDIIDGKKFKIDPQIWFIRFDGCTGSSRGTSSWC